MKVTPDIIEQFSECFHTGLRKGLDSDYSSLAWNVVHITPQQVYSSFCNYMRKGFMKAQEIDVDVFTRLLHGWRFSGGVTTDKLDRRFIIVFDCTMRCMPKEDIEGLYQWFKFCFEEEAAQ